MTKETETAAPAMFILTIDSFGFFFFSYSISADRQKCLSFPTYSS